MGVSFLLGKALPLTKVQSTSRESWVFVQVIAEDFYKRGLNEAKRKDFEKSDRRLLHSLLSWKQLNFFPQTG